MHFLPVFSLLIVSCSRRTQWGEKVSSYPAGVRQKTSGMQTSYSIHSSYKQSKSSASEAGSLCGCGTSQQGAESSPINYAGLVLDAFIYFMLWEPASEVSTANFVIRQESTGPSTVTVCHRCFSAATTRRIYTGRKKRFLPHSKIQSSQGSCPLACSLYTEKQRE